MNPILQKILRFLFLGGGVVLFIAVMLICGVVSAIREAQKDKA